MCSHQSKQQYNVIPALIGVGGGSRSLCGEGLVAGFFQGKKPVAQSGLNWGQVAKAGELKPQQSWGVESELVRRGPWEYPGAEDQWISRGAQEGRAAHSRRGLHMGRESCRCLCSQDHSHVSTLQLLVDAGCFWCWAFPGMRSTSWCRAMGRRSWACWEHWGYGLGFTWATCSAS